MAGLVSVLLPVKNGLPHLTSSVQSILRQTWRNLEVVVVDDRSTDGSAEAIAAIPDSRLRLVTAPGHGLVDALNFGLSQCRGDVIARMDADDISAPHRVETQLKLLKQRPDLVAVGSSFAVLAPTGQVALIEGVPPTPVLIRRALLLRNPLGHGTMLIRRNALTRIGGYRQREYVEDLDLWIRLLEVGDIAAVPDILYYWRISPTGVTSSHNAKQAQAARLLLEAYRRRDGVSSLPVSDVIQAVAVSSRAPSRQLRYAIAARMLRDELELRRDHRLVGDWLGSAARLSVLLPVAAWRRATTLAIRDTSTEPLAC